MLKGPASESLPVTDSTPPRVRLSLAHSTNRHRQRGEWMVTFRFRVELLPEVLKKFLVGGSGRVS